MQHQLNQVHRQGDVVSPCFLLPPVTRTTGVWPRWPQVRPFGGLKPWPDCLRARRPGPPPSFYYGPGHFLPSGDRRLVPLRRPAGRDLQTPADPVQQQIEPGQGVVCPNCCRTISAIRVGVQHGVLIPAPQTAGPASSADVARSSPSSGVHRQATKKPRSWRSSSSAPARSAAASS